MPTTPAAKGYDFAVEINGPHFEGKYQTTRKRPLNLSNRPNRAQIRIRIERTCPERDRKEQLYFVNRYRSTRIRGRVFVGGCWHHPLCRANLLICSTALVQSRSTPAFLFFHS